MKKTLKTVLIISILFALLSQNITVLAASIADEMKQVMQEQNDEEQKTKDATENDDTTESGNEEETVESNTGALNIIIDLRLPVKNQNFNVKIQKEGQEAKEPTETSKTEETLYYTFNSLEQGAYNLTIEAEGYVTYRQIIEVATDTTQLRLTNGHDIDNIQGETTNKVGVIGIGDINNDGVINENDENAMITKIESQEYDSKYDLNKDEEINIIDLSYITINKKANVTGTLVHLLNTDGVEVQKSETTGVNTENGNIEDILKNNEKYVTLGTENGEEISSENPVEISIDLKDNNNESEGITISPSGNSENNITNGVITFIDENNEEITIPIQEEQSRKVARANIKVTSRSSIMSRIGANPTENNNVRKSNIVTIESDGTIVINLNQKIAIKKITIKVTETKSNKLADISKVEFLNNMEERIPAPQMDIPENVKGIAGSNQFTVTWNRANNVTGYEVSITSEGKTEYAKVTSNTITVQNFNGKKVKNGKVFEIKVQSLNGSWKSGYSDSIQVTPEATSKPEPPDNVRATGVYKSIKVTWKDMDDTESYNLFYRVYETGEYIKVANLMTNSYTIERLEDQTRYQVYVTGVNKLGESNPSIVSVATTVSVQPAQTPKYKLINTSNGDGKVTNHIKNVTLNNGFMVDSALDIGKTALGIVDNSYTSYYQINDWDAGASYVGQKTPTIEFDDFYTMSYFTFAQVENLDTFSNANIIYFDRDGNKQSVRPSEVVMKTDSNGRHFTVIKLSSPITTNKINIGIGRPYSYTRKITIAEMCFYYHDSIEQDINNLYVDQLHVTLRDDVTAQTISELQTRLDTPDEVSGEYHPERANLQKEIDTAREILNDNKIKEAIKIDTTVTEAKDGHITFRGGLNAWQPLGVVAHEGESVIIYVGNPKMKTGTNTALQLVATQYHAESGAWHKVVQTLKTGKNEISIPSINSLDTERGGSLYINYTGNNANDIYGVRVSGGQEIPVLDLTKVTTEEERKSAVKEYITKLEKIVPQIETKHSTVHKGSNNIAIDYDYKQQDCILGATEIVLKQMMYSVSSKQILGALGNGTIDQKTEKLYNSLVAMEDMIDLFYSHKGLSKLSEAGARNQYPVSRLNIRYQRMFAGAFMYAGGKHIGIEWGSIGGLATSVPIQSEENGKYISGNYFGWGIAHEIGHIINEGAYAVAEITNNYFSVLAQAKDTNNSVRFSYDNVYKKVTSGTIGKASNVFTQLALYWQLHLAHDKAGYNYKTFDTYQEQFDNLFFARVDTYARNSAQAPAPNGIALNLNTDTDNKLMRLAVAAAQKDILEFFERWGMVPNNDTKAYAGQFEKETKAIYYITDEARAYQLENKNPMIEGTTVEATLTKENNSNKIKITLGNNHQEQNKDAMLGYEIIRSYQENDEEISRAVAFVTPDKTEYIDTIETVNNRVFTYKVIAYDKYLNQTEEYVLDPIKVSHDGSIEKTNWVIETNLTSDEDTTTDGNDQMPCEQETVKAISKIANNDEQDEYLGKISGNQGEIVITLGEQTRLVALKYKAGNAEKAIKNYEIQVSNDKSNWETVKAGQVSLDNNNSQTIYFNKENNDYLYTYDVTYVKLIIKNQTEVSISEIDLLGQTGDNVELLAEGIGRLKENYQYGTAEQFIPAGSIVFTGTYKGNPAYNAIKLWNQDNQLVEGSQIILADHPGNGELGEVSEGIWIYWIEPKENETVTIPQTIRAELYRVDDALTNQGERLVSDTYRIQVPQELSDVQINR